MNNPPTTSSTLASPSQRPIDNVSLIQHILAADNTVSGAKIQSFEREFDKTWERVAVDAEGNIAKLPPIFNSLTIKLTHLKQQQEHLNNIRLQLQNSTASTLQTQSPSLTSQPQSSQSSSSTSSSTSTQLLTNKHGVMRSICLVVDLSESSLEKDIPPTRFDFLTIIGGLFIDSFIDQHPLSEIVAFTTAQGHCTLNTGVRQPRSDYVENLKRCQDKSELKGGVFSVQNTIHSCGHLFQAAPPQACKEIIILTCSLNTIDVRDIEETIEYCRRADITVHIVGYGARVRVFERICQETEGVYNISIGPSDFRTNLFNHLKPPIKTKKHIRRGWIHVAFPTLKHAPVLASFNTAPTSTHHYDHHNTFANPQNQTLLCSCHYRFQDTVYVCPICNSHVCQLPNRCPTCSTLLLSYPLLARSAAQLHLPPPTTPAHFANQLLPLKETQLLTITDNINEFLKTRKKRPIFKRSTKSTSTANLGTSSDIKREDGSITYIDDNTSIQRRQDDTLVTLQSTTFSQQITPQYLVNKIQQLRILQRNQAGLKGEGGEGEHQSGIGIVDEQSTLLQSIAVGSDTCHSQVVCCQGCLTPLIIPTTKMLESAYAFANGVTNIVVCSCNVCKNTDLVTTCSICHCFLCSDCDQLTQSVLQNCPGCFQ